MPALVGQRLRLAVGAVAVVALVGERRAVGQPLERDDAERAPAGRRDSARDERAPVHECHPDLPAGCVDRAKGSARIPRRRDARAPPPSARRAPCSSRLAFSWRAVDFALRSGVLQRRGVGELLLERLQRGLGLLDLLLQALGLRGAGSSTARPPAAAAGRLRGRSGLRRLRALGGALVLRALLADAQVLRPAAEVGVQRAGPRPRSCGCRRRRAARGRG